MAGTTYGSDNVSINYFNKKIAPLINVTDLQFLNRVKGMTTGQIRLEIGKIADQCNSKAPVIFVGPVNEEQKQILYGNAMGTLFPIKWTEPFGRILIESMACGTPVIGYTKIGSIHCGSVEEVIEDGATGFHINAKNSRDGIDKAANAVSKLSELDRRKVREIFERDWSSSRLARQIDNAYKRCINQPITIYPGRSNIYFQCKRFLKFLN